MSGMVARRLRIYGRVQGVGYRQSMQFEAERLGIVGWVRNCSDGTVEALVCGDADLVARIVEWAHAGPRFSYVERVLISEDEPVAETGFIISFTE